MKLWKATVAVVLFSVVLTAVGCSGSSSGSAGEDTAATQKRVDAAKQMRAYFDKSNGNYESLSPQDKTSLNAITGGEKQSKDAFSHMALPTGH